jgi:alkyldihydroxyacetonephosphate synthase
MNRRRSWWGWGWEDEAIGPDGLKGIGAALSARFGMDLEPATPARLEDLDLRAPRLKPPDSLAGICSTETYDRAWHSYGRSYGDVVRGFRGEFPHPPDVIAYPGTENEVVDVLDWCAGANAAAVPFGGGSSVVGGVECDPGNAYAGVVTIDLTRLDRVLEIDKVSRAARIQGGALGPVLEDQLRPAGYTLRHFPQSFEFSTLGGWIATRSGGHYASLYTHIDDFVESVRVVTPKGVLESRRLPGSGAGPSPDRLIMGSEGILGVITEAWVRLQDRPRFRTKTSVRFSDFETGADAARALAQAGLFPSNCRLLDPTEAMLAGAGEQTVLLVAFESADHPLGPWMARARELCADHGGDITDPVVESGPESETKAEAGDPAAAAAWRRSFVAGPYMRDALVTLGALGETFETATTWDRFPELHAGVLSATRRAMEEVGAGAGSLSCRFTHVYPDGPAPYYSIVAPARKGAELEQWRVIKAAGSEAIMRLGGTITHHHAVGRDHRPWYDRQRPDLFAEALAAAKRALDPSGVLNPGVVIDPAG